MCYWRCPWQWVLIGLARDAREQVTKYVEREIVNHRTLMHPHIVQFKEVSSNAFEA